MSCLAITNQSDTPPFFKSLNTTFSYNSVLSEINQIVSEQVDIIPAQLRVIRHIRKQYACACGQCIQTAPLPGQPIPKSMASPGLLAHVVVSKYQDALPLYRQEQILQRVGVTIPRATLASWMIRCGQLVQPLINLLRDHLLAYDIVQMDETTVQVLKEPGKTAQSTSYLWLQRGGPPDAPVMLFDYDPSRSQAVPIGLLDGFAGYLQTDGYSGYNGVVSTGGLVHVGCMAHARRKFSEAVKGQGRHPRPGKAQQGLAWIQTLYRIEKQARTGLSPPERKAHRQQHAAPVLARLRQWLDDSLPTVPPGTLIGKALNYLHNEWPKLIRYLEDGRLEMDNNLAENAIRPFVVGRKNWLFSDSVHGVKASANLYSLVETAKANGLEPYQYLRRVFTVLPQAETVEDIESLLPWAVKKIPAETR
jgi:transposase